MGRNYFVSTDDIETDIYTRLSGNVISIMLLTLSGAKQEYVNILLPTDPEKRQAWIDKLIIALDSLSPRAEQERLQAIHALDDMRNQ